MFQEIPLELGAFIAGYLNQPEDINALRLSSKRCLRYAQEGISVIEPKETRFLSETERVKIPYLLLFKHLRKIYYNIPVNSSDDIVAIASGPLKRFTLLLTSTLLNSNYTNCAPIILIIIDLIIKCRNNTDFSVAIHNYQSYIDISSSSICLENHILSLAKPLQLRFPNRYVAMIEDLSAHFPAAADVDRCRKLILKAPNKIPAMNRIRLHLDAFAITSHPEKYVKLSRRFYMDRDLFYNDCLLFLKSFEHVYSQIVRTNIVCRYSDLHNLFRIFPNSTYVSIHLSDEEDIKTILESVFHQYPQVQVAFVYRLGHTCDHIDHKRTICHRPIRF